MTETRGRVFDEIGRLMTDAAGAASGVKREVETIVRAQASKILADLDLVRRDEFEIVRAMAVKAREENETLSARLDALEAKLAGATSTPQGGSGPEDTVAI
ncbi:BMFP domain-containing protein YqiC [Methylopila capsulata]|nr:accessory factor UbiK family protein [Methylopila capsulata]MBM7852145.1 BMFP domain-containing protein YqiC [Methylopila capsulata]